MSLITSLIRDWDSPLNWVLILAETCGTKALLLAMVYVMGDRVIAAFPEGIVFSTEKDKMYVSFAGKFGRELTGIPNPSTKLEKTGLKFTNTPHSAWVIL